MKKHVLITGAAGFIGYHLAKSLHKRGDFVVGIDNFNDYYPTKLKKDRAQHLRSLGVDIIAGDILNHELLTNLAETHKITHIAHLAAQAGVRYSIENPEVYIQSNVKGFFQILELCRQFPHLKLTYASSSSVYGLNTKTPFSEKDRTDHQASLYGMTKKSNELLAFTYHHLYKIPVTGLRFFTVYGPFGRPDMAYYSFTNAILEEKPIEVFNHGNMKRDFTYIDDIINGINAAIDLEAECEIFNLGNHQPVLLNNFLEILQDALGKKAQIHYLPMQKGDVETTYADIAHSQKKLGFHPKTTIREGIEKFVGWYKDYHRFSVFK